MNYFDFHAYFNTLSTATDEWIQLRFKHLYTILFFDIYFQCVNFYGCATVCENKNVNLLSKNGNSCDFFCVTSLHFFSHYNKRWLQLLVEQDSNEYVHIESALNSIKIISFFKIHFMVNFSHKELLSCNTAGWCVEILYFNRIRIQMQKNFFYLKWIQKRFVIFFCVHAKDTTEMLANPVRQALLISMNSVNV